MLRLYKKRSTAGRVNGGSSRDSLKVSSAMAEMFLVAFFDSPMLVPTSLAPLRHGWRGRCVALEVLEDIASRPRVLERSGLRDRAEHSSANDPSYAAFTWHSLLATEHIGGFMAEYEPKSWRGRCVALEVLEDIASRPRVLERSGLRDRAEHSSANDPSYAAFTWHSLLATEHIGGFMAEYEPKRYLLDQAPTIRRDKGGRSDVMV
ncbi:hypothetical protein ACOMHN_056984 [Nucella lapillus]